MTVGEVILLLGLLTMSVIALHYIGKLGKAETELDDAYEEIEELRDVIRLLKDRFE